jgi:hypothetical protein
MALSEKGFIKAFRSLDQSDIWQDAQLLRIWLTLMMRASWQDEWRRVGSAPVYCNIGDYCFSLREFADDLSLSRGFVKRRLEYLSKRDSIRLENGPRFIRATIINYEKYRDGADIDGPITGQKQANNGPITDHKRANSGPIAGQALYLEEVKEAKKDDSSLTLPKNHSPTPSNESLEPQIDQGFVADACRISESPKSLSESNLRSDPTPPRDKYTAADWQLASEWLGSLWDCKSKPPTKRAAEVIRELREIDGYTHDELREAMAFVVGDDFWCTKAISPAGLRQKNKSGVPKIASIVSQMKAAKAKEPPPERKVIRPEDEPPPPLIGPPREPPAWMRTRANRGHY